LPAVWQPDPCRCAPWLLPRLLKGRDTDIGRDLAVKVLLEQHVANPELVRRFVEEAQIAGQLQHPGVMGSPATRDDPGSQQVAGLHDYRLGRFSAALERLRPITETKGTNARPAPQVAVFCDVRARAHQKSGQTDEARRLLAAAEAQAQQAPFDTKHEGPLPAYWFNSLRYQVLHREAEALIRGAASPEDKVAR
jgi:hypothetical protein